MMVVMGVHKDGGQCKLLTVRSDFDLQSWAEKKRKSLELIGLVRLETIEIGGSDDPT